MAIKNKSMYAILGILTLAPSTGYDIKKYSDKVLSGFWNENFGHIYPTLKMMLKDGMIEVVDSKENDRAIRYGITQKGREEFNVWLLEDTLQQPVRSEFMLKLLFSSEQPKEVVIAMLENNRKIHEKKIIKYNSFLYELEQGIEDVSNERVFYLKAVLRRGIISSEAVIRWCDETIAGVSSDMSSQSS